MKCSIIGCRGTAVGCRILEIIRPKWSARIYIEVCEKHQ